MMDFSLQTSLYLESLVEGGIQKVRRFSTLQSPAREDLHNSGFDQPHSGGTCRLHPPIEYRSVSALVSRV